MTTVLVVDDAVVDRRLVGELIKKRFLCTVDYAASGLEALARIKDVAPDLIVTDLTMPEVDGLQLVTSLQVHHPQVPVILMTAFGSEALATEALARGAASYVPKSQLAERLCDTIDEVLALARSDQSKQQLLGCMRQTQFTFSLENDVALIDPLVELVQQMVEGVKLVDFTGRLQIGVALKEALLNALFHGNLEITPEQMQAVSEDVLEDGEVSLVERRGSESPYRDRRIIVDVKIEPEEATFVIRDEGPGFDATTLPDLSKEGAFESDTRRGLALMRTFTQELTFNDVGNEVTMTIRRNSD